MSGGFDYDFVTQGTRGFDPENPKHVQAAEHLRDIGMDSPHAIVSMSSILSMTPRDAFMYDRTTSFIPSSWETQNLLIDLLGKRATIEEHRAENNRKLNKAKSDLKQAKDICAKIQQVIPSLNINDPERLELLRRKYLAVVVPAQQAFLMSEYLFFLDMLLLSHSSTRVLGRAVLRAWIFQIRSHDEEQNYHDASFGRMRYFSRSTRGYLQGDPDCLDKVVLPARFIREMGTLPSTTSDYYEWDTEGEEDLEELLEQASSLCANCQGSDRKLQKCGGCHKAYYCSRECQKVDWKEGHKQLCKAWR